MNATYITYNGVFSAVYGLKLASFDSNNASDETEIFRYNISANKGKNIQKYAITNITQENPPEKEYALISDNIIHDIQKREILSWLNSGTNFVKMIIHRPETEEYYYMCKINAISEIKVNGFCVGFKLNIIFDSPYQYGNNTRAVLTNGNYCEKLLTITNKSDIKDEYIYPVLTFTLNQTGTVQIINVTDDNERVFEITEVPANKTVIIDNELKIINADGVFLSNFNKNWLRLKKGKNNLKITINGELKIDCPQIMNIGF